MEGMGLFKDIIAQARNVNDLPVLSTIFKQLENLEKTNSCDYGTETDYMIDNWDGTKITLIDGSQVELKYLKICILHSHDDVGREYSYKIGDNLYICADCLTILTEHEDLSKKYFSYRFDNFLFPKRWDKFSVISWIKKTNKRQEEYYNRRLSYLDRFDYEDEDYEDYEDYFNLEEFTSNQTKPKTINDEREDIWKQDDCQTLYNKIINYVPHPSNLTKAQRNQAKDMSISAIQKNMEPDYERFMKRVERDKERALSKRKKGSTMK